MINNLPLIDFKAGHLTKHIVVFNNMYEINNCVFWVQMPYTNDELKLVISRIILSKIKECIKSASITFETAVVSQKSQKTAFVLDFFLPSNIFDYDRRLKSYIIMLEEQPIPIKIVDTNKYHSLRIRMAFDTQVQQNGSIYIYCTSIFPIDPWQFGRG